MKKVISRARWPTINIGLAAYGGSGAVRSITSAGGGTASASEVALAAARSGAADALESGTPVTLSGGRVPTVTAASVSGRTRVSYVSYSGIRSGIPNVMRGILPETSLETWPVYNCAEVGCVAAALESGESLEDLTTVAVNTRAGSVMAPCNDCIRWLPHP